MKVFHHSPVVVISVGGGQVHGGIGVVDAGVVWSSPRASSRVAPRSRARAHGGDGPARAPAHTSILVGWVVCQTGHHRAAAGGGGAGGGEEQILQQEDKYTVDEIDVTDPSLPRSLRDDYWCRVQQQQYQPLASPGRNYCLMSSCSTFTV